MVISYLHDHSELFFILFNMPKSDKALRDAVNDALEKGMDDGDWKKAFEYTLGSTDGVDMPKVDRY